MHSLTQDLRYGLRQLLRNPGFALTAVVSLALGIGATTAMFSVIYAALMDPFPYRDVDRIVRLTVRNKQGNQSFIDLNGPQIRQLQQSSVIDSVLAMGYQELTLTGVQVPANVHAINLIASGFADLGVPPLLGRALGPADAPGGQEPQPVAVLSYKFWQKQFLSDPGIIGRKMQLDHRNYTIVGVAAPRATWYSADVYLPLKLSQDPGPTFIIDPRLKRGVTLQAADSALQPLIEQFAKEQPKRFPDHFKVQVERLNEWVMRDMSGTLYLLFTAVALLLAIGCGNVSILLLARGTARQHELAMRVALGGRRGRIVRQLLTESMLLAAFGVALGVGMSYAILAGIKAVLPRYAFAPEVVIRLNVPVLLFSAAVALATGILFGLWPALQLSRAELGSMVQSSARRVAGSVRGRRTHNALIGLQIALTLVLLAGAGSAMESLAAMMHAPLGYDPHNVLSMPIPVHNNSYTTWAARGAYFEQLRAKVAEAPGVTMTAISSNATPPRSGSDVPFEILGLPAGGPQSAAVHFVSPEYFPTLRIPLAEGRIWDAAENRNGAHVAVINRAFAQRYFPRGGAIGQSLKLTKMDGHPPEILAPPAIPDTWLQIVGMVENARNDGLSNPIRPAIFVPFTFRMWQFTQILVRAQVPPLTMLRSLQLQLAAVNPEQQSWNIVEDLDTWITNVPEWQQERLTTWVFGVFAGLALALAAVGLFSVVSYTVAQRENEFGIRMALGAQPGHVLKIVFLSTLGAVGAGITGGLILTLALNKLIGQWARGNSRDPLILLAGVLLMSVVAAVACAAPAWRASRSDPTSALRAV